MNNGSDNIENNNSSSTPSRRKLPFEQIAPTEKTLPSLRVLVVDDEPNLVHVLSRILQNLGHSVVSALAGREAINILEKDTQGFDVLFTDLSIPDVSGWEIARAAHQLSPNLPIVMVTGWGSELDPRLIINYQINLVLNKPYRVIDVKTVLQKLAEQGLI